MDVLAVPSYGLTPLMYEGCGVTSVSLSDGVPADDLPQRPHDRREGGASDGVVWVRVMMCPRGDDNVSNASNRRSCGENGRVETGGLVLFTWITVMK